MATKKRARNVTSKTTEAEADTVDSEGGLSQIPPMDPRYGDKTPEVVQWYKDNAPQEFERRYKGRYTTFNRRPATK